MTARLSLFGWGWHNEAGVHLLRLLLSKKFDQFPDFQVISGHWREMVPFYLERLDDTIPQAVTGLSRSIQETFRQHVYVTPSGMMSLPQFEFIQKVAGYSTRYPASDQRSSRRSWGIRVSASMVTNSIPAISAKSRRCSVVRACEKPVWWAPPA